MPDLNALPEVQNQLTPLNIRSSDRRTKVHISEATWVMTDVVLVPPVSLIKLKGLNSFVLLSTDISLVQEPWHSATNISHHYFIQVSL